MTADARARILAYLTDGADKGPRYYKSKHIASELDLTPKEVGVNMGILQGRSPELRIEKWGYSKSTTWRVERVLNGTNGVHPAAFSGQPNGNGHGTASPALPPPGQNGHAPPADSGTAEGSQA